MAPLQEPANPGSHPSGSWCHRRVSWLHPSEAVKGSDQGKHKLIRSTLRTMFAIDINSSALHATSLSSRSGTRPSSMPYTRLSRLSLKWLVENEQEEGSRRHSLLCLRRYILVSVYSHHQEGMHIHESIDRTAEVSPMVNERVRVKVSNGAAFSEGCRPAESSRDTHGASWGRG